MTFLGLDDLIRSKETEREDDWRDVRLLEEIADLRRLGGARDERTLAAAIAQLRSQRGLASAVAKAGFRAGAALAWQAVRRLYMRARMEEDRADKMRERDGQA